MSLLKWLCWTEGKILYRKDQPFTKREHLHHPSQLPRDRSTAKHKWEKQALMTSDIHWQRTGKRHAYPRLQGWQKQVHSQSLRVDGDPTSTTPQCYGSPQPERRNISRCSRFSKDLKQERGPGKLPQGPTGPLHSPFPMCRRENKASELVTSPVTTRVNDKVRARAQKSPLLVPYQWEQGAAADPGSLQNTSIAPSSPPFPPCWKRGSRLDILREFWQKLTLFWGHAITMPL